jgi:hypothetical protein
MQTSTLDTATTQTLYIPPKCFSLDTLKQAQIRLFLQGDGGTGKTWSALTFPNPIILSTDRGAGAHTGRKDVHEAPLYDSSFVRSICPDSGGIVNTKEAALKWIKVEGAKLTAEQTLVIDNLTGLATAFHLYEDKHPTMSSRTGKKDEFAQWSNKVDYFGEICHIIKSLKCHVVFIGHETPDRGKDGELNNKTRALLTGQFADQLKSHFTDYVRQLTCDKPKDVTKLEAKSLSLWGMNSVDEFKAMCDTYPRNTIYYWQMESDDYCNCKVSSLVNFPRFIPASYNSFIKFVRKV